MVALRKFIKHKRPHVIAVAAEDMDARGVLRDVEGILQDLKEHEDFPDALEVILVDNNRDNTFFEEDSPWVTYSVGD